MRGNEHDNYAVAVLKNGDTVGHAPRELSRIFYFFLSHDGTIEAEVAGHRKFGHGLEVRCWYTLTGKPKYIKRAKKILEGKHKNHNSVIPASYFLLHSVFHWYVS